MDGPRAVAAAEHLGEDGVEGIDIVHPAAAHGEPLPPGLAGAAAAQLGRTQRRAQVDGGRHEAGLERGAAAKEPVEVFLGRLEVIDVGHGAVHQRREARGAVAGQTGVERGGGGYGGEAGAGEQAAVGEAGVRLHGAGQDAGAAGGQQGHRASGGVAHQERGVRKTVGVIVHEPAAEQETPLAGLEHEGVPLPAQTGV